MESTPNIINGFKLDYKRELERAAKSMILVHKPETLIKLIARIIIQKVHVTHAGILLFDKQKDTYVFTVSKGARGLKIPSGLIRLDKDTPLITFFANNKDRRIPNKGSLTLSYLESLTKNTSLIDLVDKFEKIKLQMQDLEAEACIPTFFQNELIGVLVLGQKATNGDFTQEELDFFQALSSDVAMAIRNAQLFEDLKAYAEKEHQLFLDTVIALSTAIDEKDHYTHGHTQRAIDFSMMIAECLNRKNVSNFDSTFFENLKVASLLHDIGKIGIPEAILNKPGKLTNEEFEIIKQHSTKGAHILEPLKGTLKEAYLGIKHHHERYDGKGYPDGLKGDEIPIIAAIISVSDAFDAMTSDRPYRKALSNKEAVEELRKNIGTQFHPIVVNCLIELLDQGRI